MKKKEARLEKEVDDGLEDDLDALYQSEAEDFADSMDIAEILRSVDVNATARKLIWPDGQKLTLDQSAKMIHKQTGIDLKSIKRNIIAWLEMDFVPKGLDEKQMQAFETIINKWVIDYEKE